MALHIIKSAKASTITEIEGLIENSGQDQVLLMEDGCYLYTLASQKFDNLQAIGDHMQSRGLTAKAAALDIELISIKQWALLTRTHTPILTW
jgi:sulfur transfer complex TusBCD TusB component (DsrH family)